jgi:hypothetical protein
MHRQGFDLQLTQYDDRGWRATFYTTGMEHSPTSATGTAWERTPWRATQRAASEAPKVESTRGGVTLLDALYAFYQEHECCGSLDSASTATASGWRAARAAR